MIQSADQTGDTSELTKESKSGGSEREPTDAEPHRSLFFRLQKYGCRKFPSFIPDPERHGRLEMYRSRDADNNAKSEPPSDEVVDLRCVWAVEFYTPSQIPKLLRGFESLGWNTDDSFGFDRDPTRWVQRNRESQHGGGWFNLGPICRPGAGTHFGSYREAPLPIGVEYAQASMYSLTSSITCIVIGFVLDETQNRRFEQALRRERQTYGMPRRGQRYRIMDPTAQKESDIRALRAEMRAIAGGWFRAHLPGLFASGSLAGEYPTCEFLTLRNALPFPQRTERDYENDKWSWALGIDCDFYAWRAEKLRGLKFIWPLRHDNGMRWHAVIAAREEDFSDEIMHFYGGNNRHSLVFYVDEFVNKLLSRWALAGLLSGFERYLSNVRDSADFKPNDKVKPLHLLEDLGSHIAQSVDISAVSSELQNFATHKGGRFNHGINVFYPCDPVLTRNEKLALIEAIRKQIADRAEWLRNVDRSIRDILIQYGATLGASENIKLQKRMAWLTWVILALTIVMAIFAGVTTVMSINKGNLPWPW